MGAMDWAEQLRHAPRTAVRGLLLALFSLVTGLPLVIVTVVAIALVPVGVGLLAAPPLVDAVRAVADAQRRRGQAWSGVGTPSPYRVPRRRLRDPATWRDLLWLLLNVPVALVLGLLPAALLGYAVLGLLVAPVAVAAGADGLYWPIAVGVGAVATLVLAATGPGLLKAQALFSASLLRPTGRDLTARVDRLEESRADLRDAGAAELRRIEKDLHDGAQARIVALGMTIGLAEELVRRDPDAALALLAEARDTSGQALADLRRLVRGIHPPVLAERGLAEAVRALAASVPIETAVDADLPTRAPAPVEAAVYFAVAEALANVVKHSGAGHAWVDLRGCPDQVVITVGDDGTGGAVVTDQGGIAGLRKRLAAFDGTLTVDSPSGGPTVLTMSVPCGW